MIAPLSPVINFRRHIRTQLALQPDPPLLLPRMSPVERRIRKTRSSHIHGSQRACQRRVETSPVTADRKRVRKRRYAGFRVSGEPVYPKSFVRLVEVVLENP